MEDTGDKNLGQEKKLNFNEILSRNIRFSITYEANTNFSDSDTGLGLLFSTLSKSTSNNNKVNWENIIYQKLGENDTPQLRDGKQYIYINQISGELILTKDDIKTLYEEWELKKSPTLVITNNDDENSDEIKEPDETWKKTELFRKIFHPGNSLTVAFILMGVGLVLGAACPPALVFVALGLAAFSAMSAVVSAGLWLKRDYARYKDKSDSIFDDQSDTNPSFLGYLKDCAERLSHWAQTHKTQTLVMGIGLALFVTALVVTALAFTGGLAGVPLLAGFMGGMGVSGTALGTVGAMFSGALGSSALATTLASLLTGAFLVLAPVNILDTLRRIGRAIVSWQDKVGQFNFLDKENDNNIAVQDNPNTVRRLNQVEDLNINPNNNVSSLFSPANENDLNKLNNLKGSQDPAGVPKPNQ